MFKALPPGSLIDLDPGRIVAMYRSMNSPAIALGGGASTPALATVLGFALDTGLYRAYVWLGGLADPAPFSPRAGLLFVDESDGVRFDQFDVLIHGALEMVDEQGFQMERHEYKLLSPGDQTSMLETLPIRARARAARQPTPPTAIGSVSPRKDPFGELAPAPPLNDSSFAPFVQGASVSGIGTGQFQAAVDISRQISLPSAQAVDVIARMLSLF